VVAYYTITLASVAHQRAPAKVTSGQPRCPIPVILLARLAVDTGWQGVGKAMLRDACMRAVMVADIAGCRALLIHAKDETARRWYMQFGMEPSPTDPLPLLLTMKDVRASL